MKAFAKYGVFLLIGLLSFPSSVEFAHIFVGHQHEVCNNYSDSHFHGKNVDCDLFFFQKINFSYPEFFTYSLLSPEEITSETEATYLFLNTFKIHAFKQRGPPEMTPAS